MNNIITFSVSLLFCFYYYYYCFYYIVSIIIIIVIIIIIIIIIFSFSALMNNPYLETQILLGFFSPTTLSPTSLRGKK